jgi:hypothetical protein
MTRRRMLQTIVATAIAWLLPRRADAFFWLLVRVGARMLLRTGTTVLRSQAARSAGSRAAAGLTKPRLPTGPRRKAPPPAPPPDKKRVEEVTQAITREIGKTALESFTEMALDRVSRNIAQQAPLSSLPSLNARCEERWLGREGRDIEDNRQHLAACSDCATVYQAVTQGIDPHYLPLEDAYQLASDDYLEVTGPRLSKRRRLLIKTPHGMP